VPTRAELTAAALRLQARGGSGAGLAALLLAEDPELDALLAGGVGAMEREEALEAGRAREAGREAAARAAAATRAFAASEAAAASSSSGRRRRRQATPDDDDDDEEDDGGLSALVEAGELGSEWKDLAARLEGEEEGDEGAIDVEAEEAEGAAGDGGGGGGGDEDPQDEEATRAALRAVFAGLDADTSLSKRDRERAKQDVARQMLPQRRGRRPQDEAAEAPPPLAARPVWRGAPPANT